MKKPVESINVRGRFLGVFILLIFQYLVGVIHMIFGSLLLLGSYVPVASTSAALSIYSLYTLVYGFLTVFFTYLFWAGKRIGWIGTASVSLFVIIVDILALSSLFDVLGIPKTAGLGEIPYSLVILVYLLQDHIRLKYGI